MDTAAYDEAFGELEKAFGERFDPGGEETQDLASVIPADVEEVAKIAALADRYGLRLVLQGAGTATAEAEDPAGGLLVRFERLRGISLPEGDEPRVELEPGVTWIELEDHLRTQGKSLRVYPTSAPRATVGGWLARDGLGVGSFQYGWLSENVVSVEAVLAGGERRVFEGKDLGLIVGAGGATGITVRATLALRGAERDLPFAAAFDEVADLSEALSRLSQEDLGMWHLGFINEARARTGGLPGGNLLFGTRQDGSGDEILEHVTSSHRGRLLPPAESFRVWGERFFPAGGSGELPNPARVLTPLSGLASLLDELHQETSELALQGTVARNGEVLVLAFHSAAGSLESPDAAEEKILLRAARAANGRKYAGGLEHREDADLAALREFKENTDPRRILGVLP